MVVAVSLLRSIVAHDCTRVVRSQCIMLYYTAAIKAATEELIIAPTLRLGLLRGGFKLMYEFAPS